MLAHVDLPALSREWRRPLAVAAAAAFGIVPFSCSGGDVAFVFVSTRDGKHDIYAMNADGSVQTRIADSPGYNQYAVWRP